MKIKRVPTTIILLIFSWLIAILGFLIGGYLIIFTFNEINSLISGCSILLGSLLLAAVIRMLGNIGQMLFDLKAIFFNDLQTLLQNSANLSQDTKETKEILKTQLQAFSSNLQTLLQNSANLSQNTKETKEILKTQLQAFNEIKEILNSQFQNIYNDLRSFMNYLEQINCDSKDISQNIHQIKVFFEQIERHLDLKK